jgi:hypothetical protein
MVGTVDDYERAVAAAHAAAGVCHACAYDITGIRPGRDRCVVCPECGHAWRLPASVTGRPNAGARWAEDWSLFGAAILNPFVLLWRFFWPFRDADGRPAMPGDRDEAR